MGEDSPGGEAQWERVKDIVGEALEFEGDARAAFVDKACRGDAALRREVDVLLSSFADADDLLPDHAVAFDSIPSAPRVRKLTTGDRIGPYEILRKLGEGGFSTVYGALQRDPIERRVAIKLLKPGMDSEQVLQRFDKERVALMRMEHPNIARVLDAGCSESGHPYVVMDWVDGEAFTHYCDRKQLDLRSRLALFVQVCAAVQHAHVKGVVHRDLKPSNILVAEQDGVASVKVIDFGIAKALGEDEAGASILTQSGMLLGTPEYMSPEQAAGVGDIDTRTDVYSLGVLLYEVLSGARPFQAPDPEKAALHEVLRQVREDEAPRPSTRIGPATRATAELRSLAPRVLARELRGDLDWIVMKSLEKDRERRFGSVEGFAEDVERHLASEPVLAGPPSLAYRFEKFALRNRVLLVAASVAFLALVAGAVLAAIGFYHASTERDSALLAQKNEKAARKRAEASLVEADKVGDFRAGMFESMDANEKGKELRVYDLLEEADFEAIADYPLVEARLRGIVGNSYRSIGEFKRARENLQRALAIAVEREGAASERALSLEVSLANLRYDKSEQAEDAKVLQDLIRRASAALGAEHRITRNAQAAYAGFVFDTGDFEGAIPLMREVLEASIEEWGASRMRGNLAIALVQARRFDEALEEGERNLREHRAVYGKEHLRSLAAERKLAAVFLQRGAWKKARAMLEEVCARHEKKLGAGHPDTLGVYNYYLFALQKLKEHKTAFPIYERTLAAQEESLGKGHRQTMMCLHNYGMMLFDAKRYAKAEAVLRDALKRFAEHRGRAHIETVQARFHLADLLCTTKQFQEGRPLMRAALKDLVRVAGWKHPKTREAAYALSRQLGAVFGAQLAAKDEAMLETLKLAFNLAKRLDDKKELNGVARAMASAYEALGREAEAREWRERRF